MDRPQLRGVSTSLSDSARAPVKPSQDRSDHSPQNLRPAPGNGSDGMMVDSSRDLDRIREILLAGDRRDAEARLNELERRMEENTVRAELEIQRRMEAFEEQIKGELRSIADEISTEQRQRADAVDTTVSELRSAVHQVQREMQDLVRNHDSAARELRDDVAKRIEELSEAMRASYDGLNAALEKSTRDLRAESVDWQSLANTLHDLGKQVATNRPQRDAARTGQG